MAESTALSPAITKHATAVFQQSALSSPQNASLPAFLQHLDSPESSAASPLKADTSHPLSHYFISSSHNTCKSLVRRYFPTVCDLIPLQTSPATNSGPSPARTPTKKFSNSAVVALRLIFGMETLHHPLKLRTTTRAKRAMSTNCLDC